MNPLTKSALYRGARSEIITAVSFSAAGTAAGRLIFHESLATAFELSLGGAAAIIALGGMIGVLSSNNKTHS